MISISEERPETAFTRVTVTMEFPGLLSPEATRRTCDAVIWVAGREYAQAPVRYVLDALDVNGQRITGINCDHRPLLAPTASPYTSTPPTEPGWYWVKNEDGLSDAVRVEDTWIWYTSGRRERVSSLAGYLWAPARPPEERG